MCTTTTTTEDLPFTSPSKIRLNGTLGVHFKDKHQTCHKSISFPALNHTSMIESCHSNNSQTNMDDNIFQGQKVIHSKPTNTENGVTRYIYIYTSIICIIVISLNCFNICYFKIQRLLDTNISTKK